MVKKTDFAINSPQKSPLRIYKRIGVGFISLTAILLLIVMYMALSRATIIVEPNEKSLSADLLVTVKEKDLRSGDIPGKIGITSLSREAVFTSSGDGVEMPAKAEGQITVYNNSAKNQALIATTRFLSKDGVLFRLKDEVTVPAGGSVRAEIAADKEGKSGEVGPTTFTIPGLAASLQTKIFGKSEAAMTGGTAKMSVISEKDIDDAVKNLTSTLMAESADKLKTLLNPDGKFSGIARKEVIKNKELSVKAGDKAPNFKVKLELDIVGAAYDSSLHDQAAKTLSSMIASDRKLVSSNISELAPTIEKYDLEDKSANLKINLVGSTIISADSPVFDREKLAGLTVEETKQYLEKYAGIKSVEIKFFPFWVDRIPKLRDHVKVIVK
ncbi:MAG: hypothetical protein WC459_04100 [Patescibacteria group bacterium]